MRYFDIGAVCDIGLKKSVNQDRVLALVGEVNKSEFGIFAVADGVGGTDYGEFASEYSIRFLKKWWQKRMKVLAIKQARDLMAEVDKELDNLLQLLNREVYEYCKAKGVRGGTTLSILLIFDKKYIIKHTGDSRIYLLNGTLTQITEDQSWGSTKTGKSPIAKQSSSNLLAMCLGAFKELQIHTYTGDTPKQAVFILCSDGLYKYFSDEELKRSVRELSSSEEITSQDTVNKLFEKVIVKGAKDNISLIIVKFRFVGVLNYIKKILWD